MPFPPPQFSFRSFWFVAIVPQRNQGEQEFPGGRLAPGYLFSFFIVPQFFDKLNPFFVATFDTLGVTLCIGDQIGDNLDQPFRISRDFRESGLCCKDQLIVL